MEAAAELGLDRAGDEDRLTDVSLGQVVEKVWPDRTDGRGEAFGCWDGHRDQVFEWLNDDSLKRN